MLRPRDSHQTRLVSASFFISPSAELTWSNDLFGNSVAYAVFDKPTDELRIVSRCIVEQSEPRWPVFAIAAFAHSHPFDYSLNERTDLGALLVPQYPDPDRTVRDWANNFVSGNQTDTLTMLKKMNRTISKSVTYQRRDDAQTQAPFDTLERSNGTCRDFAVLFVEAVRALGLGARLVSGYLYDPHLPKGDETTHAWGEVYLPGAGWIAFDPTNAAVGSANLVALAVGRNIDQVSPIMGSFAGAASDFLNMRVSVAVSKH